MEIKDKEQELQNFLTSREGKMIYTQTEDLLLSSFERIPKGVKIITNLGVKILTYEQLSVIEECTVLAVQNSVKLPKPEPAPVKTIGDVMFDFAKPKEVVKVEPKTDDNANGLIPAPINEVKVFQLKTLDNNKAEILMDSLMEALKTVKTNKDFIPQANAMVGISNAIVNLAKTELAIRSNI